MKYAEVLLSQGNINQGHFYLPRGTDLFPADALGGKNKSEMAILLKVVFTGTGEVVHTDIDREKSLFRLARGQSRRFIEKHRLTAGDKIYITKTGDRQFSVSNKIITEPTLNSVLDEFNSEVIRALNESPENRKLQLDKAPKKPDKKTVDLIMSLSQSALDYCTDIQYADLLRKPFEVNHGDQQYPVPEGLVDE